MEPKYKIGYIDEDINQVKKYQRRFRKHGFEVIGYDFENKMNLEDLMKQVYKSDIDLLMIDYKLDETNKVTFNGEEVESEVYNKKPLFPHIIFTNKVDDAEPHVEDWKIIFDKDDVFSEDDDDDEKVVRFITTLERSIVQYRNHIKEKKKIVADLLVKGERVGLNAKEKDLLFTKQEELASLDKTHKNEIPKYLLTEDKLANLSKTKKEAEAFLKSIIDKRKK